MTGKSFNRCCHASAGLQKIGEVFVGSQVNTTPGRVQNVPVGKSGSRWFYCMKEGESLRQTEVSDSSLKSPSLYGTARQHSDPHVGGQSMGLQ